MAEQAPRLADIEAIALRRGEDGRHVMAKYGVAP
jgi:hypothetical protein